MLDPISHIIFNIFVRPFLKTIFTWYTHFINWKTTRYDFETPRYIKMSEKNYDFWVYHHSQNFQKLKPEKFMLSNEEVVLDELGESLCIHSTYT